MRKFLPQGNPYIIINEDKPNINYAMIMKHFKKRRLIKKFDHFCTKIEHCFVGISFSFREIVTFNYHTSLENCPAISIIPFWYEPTAASLYDRMTNQGMYMRAEKRPLKTQKAVQAIPQRGEPLSLINERGFE